MLFSQHRRLGKCDMGLQCVALSFQQLTFLFAPQVLKEELNFVGNDNVQQLLPHLSMQ